MYGNVLKQAEKLEQKKDFQGAINILADLISRDPTCMEAYIQLAADSGILGRFRQAEAYARKAISLDPNSGKARYYLGCALRDQNCLDEASRQLELALVLAKKEAEKRGSLAGAAGISLPHSPEWYIEQAIQELQVIRLAGGIRKKILPDKQSPVFLSIPGGLKTYCNEHHGFEIDVPENWTLSTKRAPFPVILLGFIRGVRPYADIQFECDSGETLNFMIERMPVELPPDINQLMFTLNAQDMEYTDLESGRITLGGKEHACARYCIGGKVWSKKYMIVLGGVGYAITASCCDNVKFAEKEKRWDAVVASFRLTAVPERSGAAASRYSAMIENMRDNLERRLALRESCGLLYGRAYEAVAENRVSDALSLLKRCLAESPDHILAHKEMAVVMKKLGHSKEALAHRWEVKRLDPADTANRYNLVELLAERGDRRGALVEAEELLALDPNNTAYGDLRVKLVSASKT